MTKKIILTGEERAAIRVEDERKTRAFQNIGAFIFQFSQLEFTLKVVLSRELGLPEGVFDIVTGPYDFRTLCGVLEATLLLKLDQPPKPIKDYFGKCMALNDQRNRLAHGLWSDDGAAMTARHVARSSLKAVFHFKDATAVEELIADAARLKDEGEVLFRQMLFVSGMTPEPQGAV